MISILLVVVKDKKDFHQILLKLMKWDTTTGNLASVAYTTSPITSITFSPMGGNLLVTGLKNETAVVWDFLKEPISKLVTLRGHGGKYAEVTSVGFSFDGKQIVTGSQDKTVKIWNAASGVETMSLLCYENNDGNDNDNDNDNDNNNDNDNKNEERNSSSSKEGNKSDKKSVEDGNAENMDEGSSVWYSNAMCVKSVGFTEDGSQVYAGLNSGSVIIWNARSGTKVMELHHHDTIVNSVAMSLNSDFMLTASADGTCKILSMLSQVEANSGLPYLSVMDNITVNFYEKHTIQKEGRLALETTIYSKLPSLLSLYPRGWRSMLDRVCEAGDETNVKWFLKVCPHVLLSKLNLQNLLVSI
jgi:WD40 repeat protein